VPDLEPGTWSSRPKAASRFAIASRHRAAGGASRPHSADAAREAETRTSTPPSGVMTTSRVPGQGTGPAPGRQEDRATTPARSRRPRTSERRIALGKSPRSTPRENDARERAAGNPVEAGLGLARRRSGRRHAGGGAVRTEDSCAHPRWELSQVYTEGAERSEGLAAPCQDCAGAKPLESSSPTNTLDDRGAADTCRPPGEDGRWTPQLRRLLRTAPGQPECGRGHHSGCLRHLAKKYIRITRTRRTATDSAARGGAQSLTDPEARAGYDASYQEYWNRQVEARGEAGDSAASMTTARCGNACFAVLRAAAPEHGVARHRRVRGRPADAHASGTGGGSTSGTRAKAGSNASIGDAGHPAPPASTGREGQLKLGTRAAGAIARAGPEAGLERISSAADD